MGDVAGWCGRHGRQSRGHGCGRGEIAQAVLSRGRVALKRTSTDVFEGDFANALALLIKLAVAELRP